ncbi:MAG: hypothetical protein H0U83_06335 [Sphingomonas sp.]|nr:hypothetical protein [Sphingomonas sp.]
MLYSSGVHANLNTLVPSLARWLVTLSRLNPSPWNLDVTQSGKLCVVNATKLNLWRPEAESAIQLTVKGSGVEQTIEWPAGKDTVAWPASLPVTSPKPATPRGSPSSPSPTRPAMPSAPPRR